MLNINFSLILVCLNNYELLVNQCTSHQRKEWCQPDVICTPTINYWKTLFPFCLVFSYYTTLQTTNSARSASAINLVTTDIVIIDRQVLGSEWLFCFIFRHVLPVICHYKQRAVQEAPLQSIRSLWKLWAILITASLHWNHHVLATHCESIHLRQWGKK